jgi:hypothetical protein
MTPEAKAKRGRPKGAQSKHTLIVNAARENAVQKGRSPLDVMLKNMRFYDEKAEAAMLWVENRMSDPKTQAPEVLKLLQEMSEYRMKAQKCATDAAVYVHPKLATIEHKHTTDTVTKPAEEDMSPEELSDYYNKLRLRPTTTTPLTIVIENEEVLVENDDEV